MTPRTQVLPVGAAPPGAEAVLAELRSLASEAARTGMARYGINVERAFGVSMAQIRPLARQLKRNHQLALDLWASGFHEARLVAVLIDDPKRVTADQMDGWAADFDSWDICDQACLHLFVRTPFVEEKIARWAEDEGMFVRRAAFVLLAAYAVHGKNVADARYTPFLVLVERHANDPRNLVKKAVNWALRQIGKRSLHLRMSALALAKKLAASNDRTPRWIGRDAVRELTDPKQVERMAMRDPG